VQGIAATTNGIHFRVTQGSIQEKAGIRARGVLLAMLVVCVANGCADYAPAPVSVAEDTATLKSRVLDPVEARKMLTRVAPAYEWQGDEWNLLTLLAEALRLNSELALSRAAYSSALADVEASRVSPGLTLSLAAEYAFDPPESSNWLYGIAGDVLLDRGGRRQGRIATAEVLARGAALDYASAAWSIRQRIRRALDAHVIATHEAAVADDLVAARQRQFETLQRRVAAGEIARTELELIRASLADARRVQTAARSLRTRARLDLAAAVGVPPEAIDESRLATFRIDDIAALPPLRDDAVTAALEGRPEILRAMLTYDQAEADLRIAVATQYPEIRVGPGYTWERGLAKLPFGLSLSFPNRDFSQAAIAAAEAWRSAAGRGLEAAVSRVIAEVGSADADYRAAVALLELVRSETLPTATALAEQADREFDAGSIDRAEWAAAQAGRQTARLDEITAIRGVLGAETGLEDALRQSLRGPDMAIGRTLTSAQGEVIQ